MPDWQTSAAVLAPSFTTFERTSDTRTGVGVVVVSISSFLEAGDAVVDGLSGSSVTVAGKTRTGPGKPRIFGDDPSVELEDDDVLLLSSEPPPPPLRSTATAARPPSGLGTKMTDTKLSSESTLVSDWRLDDSVDDPSSRW